MLGNLRDSSASHQERASSGIGRFVQLILFVIVLIWIVVGLIVYLMIMTSTPQEQRYLNYWPHKPQLFFPPN